MKLSSKVAIVAGALALSAAPAFAALPPPVPSNQGTANKPTTTPSGPPSNQGTANKPTAPGPGASLPAKAKAYGKLCQGQSKRHVAGQKGTPFSTCVTAMARATYGQSPRTACGDESKLHVPGQKGTPFSRCISAAAKLLRG